MIFSLIYKGDLRYITNIFNCRDDMYVCFGNYYLNIIINILLNSVHQTLTFLVCYYFSPEVFAITTVLSTYFAIILKTIQTKKANAVYMIFTSLGYFLIIFSSLIYNEIVVCNFWGLIENTWKVINKKAEDDYLGVEGRDTDTNSIGEYEFDINFNKDINDKQKIITEMTTSPNIIED